MTNFVLIPGAWLGAWAWKDVVRRLERNGHSALPITLTGMGDRVHLATESVGMETAIQDVLNAITYNEVGEFVLVGHSFAGKVAAAVADRVHSRVRKVVYVNSFRPDPVTTPQGGFDPSREFGPPPPGGLGIPLTDATIAQIGKDLSGESLERMRSLATPWPVRLGKDSISLSPNYRAINEAYLFCSLSGDPVDEIVAGKWGELRGPHRILESGHWPMLTRPDDTARALIELA